MKQSVPVAAVSGDTVAAYDGWLFTHDEADNSPGPQHIRATDLITGTTRVVAELPGAFLALNACGKDRVCVLTQTQPANANAAPVTKLTSIDVRRPEVLWQRDSTYGAGAISSTGGATMVVTETGGAPEVFDASGKLRYRAPLSGQWLDGKSLLVAMPDGTGRLARLSVGTYKLTPYAKLLTDFGIKSCTSNSTRLACFREDTGNLQVWKLD
jgi:hypothetical protein